METGQAIDDGPNLIPVERSRVKKGGGPFQCRRSPDPCRVRFELLNLFECTVTLPRTRAGALDSRARRQARLTSRTRPSLLEEMRAARGSFVNVVLTFRR
jgi:hypothetical protein